MDAFNVGADVPWPAMNPDIQNQLGDRVRAGSFCLDGVRVLEGFAELGEAIDALARELSALFPDPSAAGERLAPARRLYRALGLDPTRTRPASEALLRRILLGKGLYRVNSAVDAANLASLSLALPVGLYDLAKIESGSGQVTLRLGAPGEEYPGIGKEVIHLEGRPCLVDDRGPFGNPSSDSARTQVTTATAGLFFVLYAPADLEVGESSRLLDLARDTMLRWCGGRPLG